MRRWGLVVIAAMLGLPLSGLEGQVSGRWRVTLRTRSSPQVLGELWLSAEGTELFGTLGLETSDSAPTHITGRATEDGGVEFEVHGPVRWRFVGQRAGVAMRGEAWGATGPTWTWRADRLEHSAEFYPALPRFTLRQIIVQSADDSDAPPVPGAWVRAAETGGYTADFVVQEYRDLAERIGVVPLEAGQFGDLALLRAMGLYRREEMVAAHRATLEQIRRRLSSDTLIAQFNALFHPAGDWLVDIHDVARAAAQRHQPSVEWTVALPALAAANLLTDARTGDSEIAPLALYRLFVLSQGDSGRFRDLMATMSARAPGAVRAVEALLHGYAQAVPWYKRAMEFLLTAPWLDGGRPLAGHDLFQSAWPEARRMVPEIQPRLFGYPEGAPVVGAFPLLMERLIVAENWSATRWLARHGRAAVRRVLQGIQPAPGEAAVLEVGGTIYDVSAVSREASRTPAGFLEPSDRVLIDPSYMPLLGLGTVLHEWQHVLHEHARLRRADGGGAGGGLGVVLLRPHYVVAEGLAEWFADAALRELAPEFPLLRIGEAEKRAAMARRQPADPHVRGYLLVRMLADVIAEPAELIAILTRWGDRPGALVADPRIAMSWGPWAGGDGVAADRTTHGQRPVLIPEVTFTIDGGFPEVLTTRIVAPLPSERDDLP